MTKAIFQYKYHAVTCNGEVYKMAYIDLDPYKSDEVLVLLHGVNRNCRDFDYLAQYLLNNNKYRVILIDIVGRGKSDWLLNKDGYTYETYISNVYQLLSDINVDKVSIVGTSMGGIIAMMMASKFPSLVQRIVLNDIGPYIDYDILLYNSLHVATYPCFKTLDEARIFIKKYFSSIKITSSKNIEHLVAHGIIVHEGGYALAYDPEIGVQYRAKTLKIPGENFDIWHIWNALTVPIFVIRGANSKVLNHETIMKMTLNKNNFSYVEILNVGHAPSLFEDEHMLYINNWLRSGY